MHSVGMVTDRVRSWGWIMSSQRYMCLGVFSITFSAVWPFDSGIKQITLVLMTRQLHCLIERLVAQKGGGLVLGPSGA